MSGVTGVDSGPGRAEQLAIRRARLVQRSGHLRRQVDEQLRVVQPALQWADRAQDAWHWLRANPLVVAGGVLGLVVWRPRRALGLVLRGWAAWRLIQRARKLGLAVGNLR